MTEGARRRPRRKGGTMRDGERRQLALATRRAALAREIAVAERGFSAVRLTWHPRADNDAADVLVRELLWGPSGSRS